MKLHCPICKQKLEDPTESCRDCNGNYVPNYFRCNKCKINFTVSETVGLKSLENQNKEIKSLKKHRTWTWIISGIAVIISVLTFILTFLVNKK